MTTLCFALGLAVPAAAQSGTFTCDVTSVLDPLISSFPSGAGFTAQEICGVEALENAAYTAYMTVHGYAPESAGDPLTRGNLSGQTAVAGYMFGMLTTLAFDQANDPSMLNADQQGALQWLQQLVGQQQVQAAQDAVNEYNQWSAAPCAYAPPNTTMFSWNSVLDDPACGGTLEELFSSAGPTYSEFLEYGSYDAEQALGMTGVVPNDEPLVQQGISAGAITLGSLLVAFGPQLINGLTSSAFEEAWTTAIIPHYGEAKILQYTRAPKAASEEQIGEADAAETENTATTSGETASTDVTAAGTGEEGLVEGGVDAGSSLADLGPSILTGPAFIIALALAIGIAEGQQVVQQSQIPSQLQSNLTSVKSAVASSSYLSTLLGDSTGTGYQTALQVFESQVNLNNVGTATNPAAAPSDGTVFQVEVVSASGQTLSTAYYPTLQMASWPVGVGASGAPFETFAVAGGRVWHTPDPDQAAAGLQGYLGSGELHYYGYTQGGPVLPRAALLNGTTFLDMPSPGTIDQLGQDAGDSCASGDCAQVAYLQIPISDISIVQAGANLYNGSYYRVSLVRDQGAPPGQEINNQYGEPANADTGGYPNGGLIAGQTVQLFDPEVNPAGIPATYTWQVETRCAYDPSQPPHTLDGLPVCAGSPGYATGNLLAHEKDLIVNGAEDPAFHGDPVDTLVGQSVSFTWPAPGTYHVRLITRDQYGVSHQSDQDVTVGATGTTVPLTAVPGFSSVSAVGPVHNGSAVSITGCIDNPAAPYGNPQVSVNWGDGSATDTQLGQGGGDAGLTFHHGGTGLCASPWSFTATHAYNLANPNGVNQISEPVTLTVDDGFGDTVTDNLGVNVSFLAAPTITSAGSTTFTATNPETFTVSASGIPTPTLTLQSGSLPPGIAFEPQANGTALITGATAVAGAGAYPLTIAATNSAGTQTQPFPLDVTAPPTITSPSSGVLTVGAARSLSFTATGYPVPGLTLSGANLPSDLTFAHYVTFGGNTATATLSGTPSSSDIGTYDLTLTAKTATDTVTKPFTLTISSQPSFTSRGVAGWTTCTTNGQGQKVGYQSFDVTAAGFPQPTITQTGGTLPTGLTFYPTTVTGATYAEISGCTSKDGAFPINVKADNGASATQTLTINVSPTGGPALAFAGNAYSAALSTSSESTALFDEGQSGDSLTITSSDPTAAITETGGLPAGLTFTDNGNGTATIAGTPDAGSAGSYGLTIKSTGNGLAFLTIDVFGPPRVTSPSAAAFDVGTLGSFTVATGGLPLAGISLAGTLPTGLTFKDHGDGTATIAGTPAAGTLGTYSLTVSATNVKYVNGSPTSTPQTVKSNLTIEVGQAPAFTSASSAGFGIGASGTFTVTTTGDPTPALSVSAGTLPAGLTFSVNGDGTGIFLGSVPAGSSPASYPLELEATSVAGAVYQAFTLNVGPQPGFRSLPTATFAVGSAGSFTIDAAGTPTPALTESGTPPAGLTFTGNGDGTATLSGTPQAGDGGASTLQVTATSLYGAVTQSLAVVVDQAPAFTGTAAPTCASAASATSQAFTAGSPGRWTICTAGYPQPALSLGGSLPAGLTFTDNGDGSATIQGTPAAGTAGAYPLVLAMSNTAGTQTQALTLNDEEPIPLPSQGLFLTWVAGQVSSYTYTASVWPAPTFSLGPTAPAWVTLTDRGGGIATLSGTPPPNAAGTTAQLALLENNGVGSEVGLSISIRVPRVGFAEAAPPAGAVGQPYTYTIVATDPNATFAPASGSLPPGLTLSPSGLLSGTPTTVGSSTFSIAATDGPITATTVPITVSVAAAPHTLEIAQFRLSGPVGANDWFVEVYNTTSVALPLSSWRVGISLPNVPVPALVPLGSGSIAAHGMVTLAGPYFSLSSALSPAAYGPPGSPGPGGVEIVASDGTVTDVAGELGGPAALVAGTGLTPPPPTAAQGAFVRKRAGGAPVDTNDNAADFTYGPVAGYQGPILASIAPASGPAGTPVTLTGSGFGTVAGHVYWVPATGAAAVMQPVAQADWSDGSISTAVPSGLGAGADAVSVYGPTSGASNAQDFMVTGTPSLTIALRPSSVAAGGAVTVSGAVYDSGGAPVANTPVDVALSGTVVASVSSGAGGGYTARLTAPGASGAYAVTATTTVDGVEAAASHSLEVTGGSTAGLVVTTASLPGGVVGQPYPNALLQADGGSPPYTWSLTSGSLPSGIRLDTVTGAVYGTPTAAGTSFFTVQARGSAGLTAARGLALYVAAAGGATVTASSSASAGAGSTQAVAGGSGSTTPETTAAARGGNGTVVTAQWSEDPEPRAAESFASAGTYFDVAVSTGSTFTSLALSQCGLTSADSLYWWTGRAWAAVSPQQYAGGCVTADLNATTSSPMIAELTGTPFAVGSAATAAPNSPGGRIPVPVVSALQPTSGPAAGGTAVTIAGLNLGGATRVSFGPNPAVSFTVDSSTQITAVSPAGSGTVDVTVATGLGRSATGPADEFTYTVPTAQSTPAATFPDVPSGYWAHGAIEALAARGIVAGMPGGVFQPDARVTRAQFVKMLALTLGLKPSAAAMAFADVPPSAWYAPYVAAATSAGIVQGETATRFGPGDSLTREQMAVLLARALKLARAASLTFTDSGQIDAWAMRGVEEAVAAGYIHGFPDGTLRPLSPATRAQAAAVLAQVLSQSAG